METSLRPVPLFALFVVASLAALSGCTTPSDGGSGGAAPAPPIGTGSSGGKLKIGMMPKKKGIPYFNACQKGAEEAAKELGDVELIYDGPIEDKSEQQSQMLDTWTTRKLDAVAIACNDPDQIATSLARARDEGLTVITFDADANPETSKRQFHVKQVADQEIAEALVDEMAKQAGEAADIAVISSSPTAPNQTAWLKAMDAYRATKYPKMKVITTEYGEEDQTKSEQAAQNVLKAYPNVKGLWAMTSVAFPGAAGAVKKAGKSGQVAIVGLGTPNVMRQFVDEGVVKSVILWNPIDLGYLTIQVARAVAKGDLKEGAITVKAGRLGELKIDGQVVLLGKPMIFDKDNIGKFNF